MSEKGYTKLNTGKPQDESDFIIEIEEVQDKPQNISDEADSTDEPSKEQKVAKKDIVEDPVDNAGEQRKTSRAEKRIRELHAKTKEQNTELENMRAELEELRKTSSVNTKQSKEQLKETLENQVANLSARMKKAIEEGDAGETVKVQDELITAKSKLLNLSEELSSYSVYEPKKEDPKSVKDSKVEISQKALDWVEDHPQFKTDPIFNGAAIAVNNKLVAEGWDASTDEFYEEINARLAKRFPEIFGVNDEDGVESNKDSSKNVAKKEKTEKEQQKPRHTDQVVSGASRTPSTTSDGKPITNSKTKVTLSQEDIRLARRWNMTPEQFARRKLSLQNKERGDYTPIFGE